MSAHAAFADTEGGGAHSAFNRPGSFGAAPRAPAAPAFGSDGFMNVGAGTSAPVTAGSGGFSSPFPGESSMSSHLGGGPSGGAPSSTGGSMRKGGSRPYVPVASYEEDSQNDAPLLQELGVDFGHMYAKVMSVLHPLRRVEDDIMADADMAGPIVFCIGMGFLLLLAGKVHFGYIYGFGGFGVISMYLILNLMADERHPIDFSRTFSVLGYCLLPVVALAALAVVINMRNFFGAILGVVIILWSAWSSTRFFEAAMHMQQQRWLIAFPSFLLYSCFVLITIF